MSKARVSVHTWNHFLPEIQDVISQYQLTAEIKYPPLKNATEWKKFGISDFSDVDNTELNGRIYTTIYFYQDQNLHTTRDFIYRQLYQKCYTHPFPNIEIKQFTLHYKFSRADYIRHYVYLLPDEPILPRYPIYIVSKGRYKHNIFKNGTCQALEKMKVSYRLCLMTDEVEEYKKTLCHFNSEFALEPISIDDNNGLGGTPQRNKCWEHAKSLGYTCHWVLDDNIDGWYWYHRRTQTRIDSGIVFRNLEDVVDNIQEPIALSAHSYKNRTPCTTMRTPIIRNGKTFSSILVNHTLLDKHDIRWRLKYNEDIDLGLQALQAGLNTFGYEVFLADKKTTKDNKEGGNKEIYENYSHAGFQKKLDVLMETWSHVDGLVKATNNKHKDGRPHHNVNWSHYKQQPVDFTVKHTYTDFQNYGIIREVAE